MVYRLTLENIADVVSDEVGITKKNALNIVRQIIKRFSYQEICDLPKDRLTIVNFGHFKIRNKAVRFTISKTLKEQLLDDSVTHLHFVGYNSDIVVKTVVRGGFKQNPIAKTEKRTQEIVHKATNVFFRTIALEMANHERFSVIGVGRFRFKETVVNNNLVKNKKTLRVSFTPAKMLRGSI